MVSWSLETLWLALLVIAAICVLYITYLAFKQSPWWGLAFLASIPVFVFGSRIVGPLIVGIVIFAAQFYFVRKYWSFIGRFFVYTVICWVGSTAITIYKTGVFPPASALAALTAPDVVEQAGQSAPVVEDTYLAVDGGRIWYKQSGSGTGTPVILVHGGPGWTSHYLKPLEGLGDERPVVRYDQLGSGGSTPTKDTTFFKIPHFVAELDSLRSALGYNSVHLVGHSWGSILAYEYYRAHPDRVASLTLASPALSSPAWMKTAKRLLTTLSDSAQRTIKVREATRDFDAADYLNAVNEYYGKYVWLRPVEADLDSANKTMSQAIYSYMWGPAEFNITGTLKTYDATRGLRRIKVPVMYTVGTADEADTTTVKRFASLTPDATLAIIPDAAHVTMWDNPEETLRVIRWFLKTVDSTNTANAAAAAAAKAAQDSTKR